MTQLGELTGTLDALIGLASAAVNSPEPWSKPEVVEADQAKINFIGLRHPLLEQGSSCVVSNDVNMTSEKRMMILTGPNMGGKSTYLSLGFLCSFYTRFSKFRVNLVQY